MSNNWSLLVQSWAARWTATRLPRLKPLEIERRPWRARPSSAAPIKGSPAVSAVSGCRWGVAVLGRCGRWMGRWMRPCRCPGPWGPCTKDKDSMAKVEGPSKPGHSQRMSALLGTLAFSTWSSQTWNDLWNHVKHMSHTWVPWSYVCFLTLRVGAIKSTKACIINRNRTSIAHICKAYAGRGTALHCFILSAARILPDIPFSCAGSDPDLNHNWRFSTPHKSWDSRTAALWNLGSQCAKNCRSQCCDRSVGAGSEFSLSFPRTDNIDMPRMGRCRLSDLQLARGRNSYKKASIVVCFFHPVSSFTLKSVHWIVFRLLKSFRMPFLANNFICVFLNDFIMFCRYVFFMVENMTYGFLWFWIRFLLWLGKWLMFF